MGYKILRVLGIIVACLGGAGMLYLHGAYLWREMTVGAFLKQYFFHELSALVALLGGYFLAFWAESRQEPPKPFKQHHWPHKSLPKI